MARLKPNGDARPSGSGIGGLIKIGKPGNVDINAVRNSGCFRLVVGGSTGSAIYVAWFLPSRRLTANSLVVVYSR